MRSRYGTSHFVSRAAAERYYRAYGYTDVQAAVRRKLDAGEIHIGAPECGPHATCYLDADEGRYVVEIDAPAVANAALDWNVWPESGDTFASVTGGHYETEELRDGFVGARFMPGGKPLGVTWLGYHGTRGEAENACQAHWDARRGRP